METTQVELAASQPPVRPMIDVLHVQIKDDQGVVLGQLHRNYIDGVSPMPQVKKYCINNEVELAPDHEVFGPARTDGVIQQMPTRAWVVPLPGNVWRLESTPHKGNGRPLHIWAGFFVGQVPKRKHPKR